MPQDPPPPPPTSDSKSEEKERKGLSTGAIVGITVGAVIGVTGLVALGTYAVERYQAEVARRLRLEDPGLVQLDEMRDWLVGQIRNVWPDRGRRLTLERQLKALEDVIAKREKARPWRLTAEATPQTCLVCLTEPTTDVCLNVQCAKPLCDTCNRTLRESPTGNKCPYCTVAGALPVLLN